MEGLSGFAEDGEEDGSEEEGSEEEGLDEEGSEEECSGSEEDDDGAELSDDGEVEVEVDGHGLSDAGFEPSGETHGEAEPETLTEGEGCTGGRVFLSWCTSSPRCRATHSSCSGS